ncbi:MAG: uroporphyrinogen decarboxylase family protein, partial [Oscillospiraceae bacterium]|nr:uroporphyrinogen decarboxylase family protein [Oscillospiraceae bacterium]
MSKERLLKTLRLEQTDRVAQYEWLDHPEFILKHTGIDPYEEPEKAVVAAIKKFDIDWYVGLPKRANKFAEGESSKKIGDDLYVTKFGFTGSYWRHTESKFEDDEMIYEYDPYAKASKEQRIAGYRSGIEATQKDQESVGDFCYISGIYYTTLFQWFILTFGWEPFLAAAASDPARFKSVIDRFADMSVEYAEYFAKTDLPVFYCHDDLAMTRGLVFPKEWYIKNIFPAYERIFEPLKRAKKPVLFVSDGNYIEIIPEILSAGADGLIVDHFTDMDAVMKSYGGKHPICGNVHIDALTYGTRDDVK